MSFHYQKDLHMKYVTGAFAFALMVAGLATSTPAAAVELCSNCKAEYDKCVAAGGDFGSCWKCNNPTCSPFSVQGTLGSALDHLSVEKSRQINAAKKRGTATLLDS
ncbi:hypothetical protein L2Y96_07700 [Luteibacter aegosomaticola]|uniref:hypothetical protein n=1 Tax=Luteibacter aegosomaticola TaxID=2911538 RepID=UPI001FFB4A80|nr:hypothetical protein [Luteibacter aegosomaticola]UPG91639.1 hypothetical protein L2Y96_07700 [Luteibacter aegosomaticola]